MSKRKSNAIVDEGNYSVVCAGVRHGSLTRAQALQKAESLNREWATLGFNGGRGRTAEVYYRDGSLVATFPPSDVNKVKP